MATSTIKAFVHSLFGHTEHVGSLAESVTLLDVYYRQVDAIILERQDPLTGLLPASTAITSHGDYTDAWVRDNVYSIMAAWALGLAYRSAGVAPERAYILEQSVIKLMRGLMISMMRQSAKVERFKHTQHPIDALHAKYGTRDGQPVVGDDAWGHLQLDATSLFLLTLAQMSQSGLRIVASIDEVNFVQNLVHYISRAYRTPDYGIWERGHKLNHGEPELNASSIGMALAALEALDGFNLFGKDGGQASLVHVVADDIARTRIALNALLPRESSSKEVDSALLSITGFPAFAVTDSGLCARTTTLCVHRLEGNYGFKRFLLDGHQTVIEDPERLHYEPHELKAFAHIECEWPLFYCYRYLNSLFAQNEIEAAGYRKKLASLAIEQQGLSLIPELFYVSEHHLEAERTHPGSQARLPNDNIPLVWAQSLFLMGNMVADGLLSLEDIDPLGRHRKKDLHQNTEVQVALLAEDDQVKRLLDQLGLLSQTRADIQPIEIRPAQDLMMAYHQVGRNDRMGLTGRPLRQLRTLSTARLYMLSDHPVLFIPQFLDQSGFYLALDNILLIERIKTELQYLSRYWQQPERKPILLIHVHHNMVLGKDGSVLLAFLQELALERAGTPPSRFITLSDFSEDTAYERIGKLHDFSLSEATQSHTTDTNQLGEQTFGLLRFWDIDARETTTLPELLDDETLLTLLSEDRSASNWLDILRTLTERHGKHFAITDGIQIVDALEDLYRQAAEQHDWRILRITAALLEKYDINLEQAATEITVRQHGLTLGKSYSGKATVHHPMDSSELLERIRRYNPGNHSLQILIQELIIASGLLIKQKPDLFKHMNTVRVGHLLDIIIAREKRQCGGSLDQAFERVLSFAPHQLSDALKETLGDYAEGETQLMNAERLSPQYTKSPSSWAEDNVLIPFEIAKDSADNWLYWREQQGSMGREDNEFFEGIYELLNHCEGLMIGGKYNTHRRIDSSDIRSHMTAGERSFKLRITHLLDRIQAPEYRHLTVETLRTLSSLVKSHPDIHFGDTLVTDILIGHAVRIHWMKQHDSLSSNYEQDVSLAWSSFYHEHPDTVASALIEALSHLSVEQESF